MKYITSPRTVKASPAWEFTKKRVRTPSIIIPTLEKYESLLCRTVTSAILLAHSQAVAALTESMGGRPSATRLHLFPLFLLKKSCPLPVPT